MDNGHQHIMAWLLRTLEDQQQDYIMIEVDAALSRNGSTVKKKNTWR